MSIILALKKYLNAYSGLKVGAPMWVDCLGVKEPGYSIVTLPGTRIVSTNIDGSTSREFPFAFRSRESTNEELERLENVGFYEEFNDWMEAQTELEVLPTLVTGKTATAIMTTGWAYLYEQGKLDSGVYQVQCKLAYDQVKR